jgi:predicted RND superfamily exporter protein
MSNLDRINSAIERNTSLISIAVIIAVSALYFPAFRNFCASLAEAIGWIVAAILLMALIGAWIK